MSWKRSCLAEQSRTNSVGPAFCSKAERAFRTANQAACGYAELGMTRQSLAELKAIEPRLQIRPEVLHLRLHHLMQRKSWRSAYQSAENFAGSLRNAAPVSSMADFVCTSLARRPRRANSCSLGPPFFAKNRSITTTWVATKRSWAIPTKRATISKSVSTWTLLSRACEERSGPRLASAGDLSATQRLRSGGLQAPNIKNWAL